MDKEKNDLNTEENTSEISEKTVSETFKESSNDSDKIPSEKIESDADIESEEDFESLIEDMKNDDSAYMARLEMRKKRENSVKKQKRMLAVCLPAVILIIIISTICIKHFGSDTTVSGDAALNISESQTTESTNSDENVDNETEDSSGLTKNMDEDIQELVENYFAAISACDAEALAKYVDDIGDITTDTLEANAQYIETYENIECYTKMGLYDNTYIVYVYYENKILNIETKAPGATTLYVIRDEETDTVCIHNGVTTGEIASYIEAVSNEDDVVEFFAEVNQKLSEACESDEDLKAFYEGLTSAVEKMNQMIQIQKKAQKRKQVIVKMGQMMKTPMKIQRMRRRKTMNDGICYLFCAGDIFEIPVNIRSEDYIIAVDRGYEFAQKNNFKADMVLGDFDSLGKIPAHENVILHKVEKDDTDSVLAVSEGLRLGYKKFIIYVCYF